MPAPSRTVRVLAGCAIAAWLATGQGVATAGSHPEGASYAEDEVRPSIDRRLAVDDDEVPDFRRHVLPLLGRLGCNGRACHGSFQGQGGFRLSLFGHDFQADHRALTLDVGESGRRRVDPGTAHASLILLKGSGGLDHEGGSRFDVGAWPGRLLERWIRSGAGTGAVTATVVRLDVEPAEIVASPSLEPVPLRVIATWSDGWTEDVTVLSRFHVIDDAVAAVDPEGRVRIEGLGDTHVVVHYDDAVATLPVLVPRPESRHDDAAWPPPRTHLDELVIDKLRRLGVHPSAPCTDAEFLRRASIDLTGTLPTSDEVREFLADPDPAKRDRKIEQLLSRPAYAAWWANRLCDMTGNSPFRQGEGRLGQEVSLQWFDWFYARLLEETPFDEMVAGIVLADSREPGESYPAFAARMSSYLREQDRAEFATAGSMPHFWARRNLRTSEEKALAFAHSFLGIRLQCAQCHKHPHDRWTQDDFRQLARLFEPVRFGIPPEAQSDFERLAQGAGQSTTGEEAGAVTPEAAALAAKGRTIAWREVYVDRERVPRGPVGLLGDTVECPPDGDPRTVVMDWARSPENPYFARAIVNRIWKNHFGVGLVEPVDDLSLANPASNEPLLAYLTRGFVASGYDLKWLHRRILESETYQRSWRPDPTNADDRRNFSRAIPTRMPAEVLYDAIKHVTASSEDQQDLRERLDRRTVGHLATHMSGTYAQRVFGQPQRLMECDCERNDEPTLLQAIFLQNDPLMQQRLAESDWIAESADLPDEGLDDFVMEAYLRAFGRPAASEEIAIGRAHIREAALREEGMRDLLWALLNSKEFLLDH